ncbi:hypothetical protein QVD17_18832 [Tagetes erecta]|uniref:Uncharacterized protein n=1 Tax=Tagetes erecta TaxID=13708 RepID=A0AAD8NW12_TARER|nr:hypothetical protein QVD17_18832 [Tagetes erecta]
MERLHPLPPNRSTSFPSTLHPASLRVESELNKLRAWEIKSCSSTKTITSGMVQTGLVGLSEVYRCAEELVYSSLTQHGKMLENALEHSLKLLDTCGIVRDTQHKIREQVLCLQSSFRRPSTQSRLEDKISTYFKLRKKLNKEASKCIRSLKQSEKNFLVVVSLKDQNLTMVVKILREVNVMTSRVLRVVLMYLSSTGTGNRNKRGGCSLIQKLRPTATVEKIVNEVGSVDGALLCVLHATKEMTMVDRKIEHLVVSLDSIEVGLDAVFRRLIGYRVSILNILTR